MDPFNSQPMPASRPEPSMSSGGSGNDPKRKILQQLMEAAMGGPNKSIHDAVQGIKTALGAYKGFEKAWDSANGNEKAADESMGAGQMMKQNESVAQPPLPPEPEMPPVPPMDQAQMPAMGMQAPVPPKLPGILPPPPPLIAGPMPSFMGGGNPM